MKIFLINLLIFNSIMLHKAFSQQTGFIQFDSVYSGNFFNTNLYNDINVANLNSLLNYSDNFGSFGISVTNNYLSNVSKLTRNFYRDYNNFRGILFYNINPKLDAGVGVQKIFFTDDKNVSTNQNRSDYYFANFDYYFNNQIGLNSKLGFKEEEQIGEFNSGFSGIVTTAANNYSIRNYLANGNLVLFYEDLGSKQNHNYEFDGNLAMRFSPEAQNNGGIRYYNMRNDFYFPASFSVRNQFNVINNIETMTDNFFYAGDQLNYSLNSNTMFSINGFYINRIVTQEYKYKSSTANILLENTYDNKMLENNLEVSGSLSYTPSKIFSQAKLIYSERSENHSLINISGLTPLQIAELQNAERNKNNNSRRGTLVLDFLYYLSNTNSFGFTGSNSLLKYDTDFENNFDDRDELETVLSGYYNYNNLVNFNLLLRMEVILSNLKYLYSQRSANNYKNKIYKLLSQSTFTPVKQFTTSNAFQILANYTVYDFEDIVSQVQSFSYRQLNIRDSSSLILNRNLSLGFYGELKIYEQGEFNNQSFSVKPFAYYEEVLYNPELRLNFNYNIGLAFGYLFYQQRRYQYDNLVKILTNVYQSYGPVGKINLYLNKNSIINFTGGLNFIEYSNPSSDDSAINLQINVAWNM